ncbi:hypothetical protein J1605_013686 [Eschrichtius robustus]|uniref:Uncharacterized protein n=1 Tax=Eschrichtius robustus TaxID=9764 RepID=A0AB34GFS3_ESCRO|nr:hypothetical protein J1605_013686 [Eschrichtius robustus]
MVSMVTGRSASGGGGVGPALYTAQAHRAALDARRLQFRRESSSLSFRRSPIVFCLCLVHALRVSVTQYSSACVVWSRDAEHGAFLEAVFGISRRRRVDWKRGAQDELTPLRVGAWKRESRAIPDRTKR